MTQQVLGAPASQVGWRAHRVALAGDATFSAIVLPQASVKDGYWCLPSRPALARDDEDRPRFGLTVLLERTPSASEGIFPLVEHGLLSLTVSLGVPEAAIHALEEDLGAPCQPAFARSLQVALARKGAAPLAEAGASGINPTTTLGATLPRDDALDVLNALGGAPSAFLVTAKVSLRTVEAAVPVHLTGRWTDVYDALRRRLGPFSDLSRRQVEEELAKLLSTQVVTVEGLSPNGGPPAGVLDALVRGAAFLLERRAADRYALRSRPSPALPLDVTETVSAPREEDVDVAARLDDLLGEAGTHADLSKLVSLATADGSGTGLRGIPPLGGATRAAGPPRKMQLAQVGGTVRSLPLVLTPDRRLAPAANVLIASGAVHQPVAGAHAWVVHDVVTAVAADDPDLLSLPTVDDPAAAVFPDRADASKLWYAPGFEVVVPQPRDDPASSAFRFGFTSTGVVVGGGSLSTGLRAEVRLTVSQVVPAAAQAAIADAGGQALPLGNLAVSIELPFRETGSDETKAQRFVADVEQSGETITATVGLLDDWARLAYGALAYPNFQAQPARLRIAYAYRAYAPIDPDEVDLAFGGKTSRIEIAAGEETDAPVFDPVAAAVRTQVGRLQFEPERHRGAKRAAPRGRLASATITRAPAFAATVAATPHMAAAIQPQLGLSPALFHLPRRPRYVLQTIVREEAIDVLLPCSAYGAFYLQSSTDGTERAVGCRDVLKLGETEYRQYEELFELRDRRHRVFRSLQQPGRFLVLPASYRITRYGPSEPPERAFRPVILLYGIVDRPPAESRYFLSATLQPDIPEYARRALATSLISFAPHDTAPALDFPTDPAIQAAATFRWALPDGIEQPEVSQVWDTFQVSVSTGLVNALALTTLIETSGLTGQVTFGLPDGLSLTSELTLDTAVIGPWSSGPVEVALSGPKAKLTNRTEQTVNVSDVEVGSGARQGERISAELTLAPAASGEVEVGDRAADVFAIYEPVPQKLTLEQLDVFVEDVATNVLIVNLVDYESHGLASLEVTAHLKGGNHDYTVTLADGQSGEIDMTLPLTTYLDDQILEFRLTKHLKSGEVASTGWLSWNLKSQGTIVSITPQMVE